MGRPWVSVALSSLMLFSLLVIVPPSVAADESTEIVEPICNANRNDTWTVGLIYCDDRINTDYTLFAPISSANTYLIDSHGREVHSWTSSSGLRPGLSAYMLEDGDLLRTANIGTDGGGAFAGGGMAGKVERISWDGQMEWEWYYAGDSRRSHHDIEPLPNGNFLMIAWEAKSEEEAIQAGRDPNKLSQSQLWPDHIVEVEPVGTSEANIVWKWHMWDHLIQDHDATKDNYGVVADHPELLDINFVDSAGSDPYKSDWMHCNGIDYNPILDQIALSCKNTNEIYIIDHSTTTEEAAGHTGGNSGKGGDILYRWGNPEAYRAGTAADQQLFAQHDVQWIQEGRPGAGDLLLYNNGNGRSVSYSSVDVISPPLENGEYVIESGSAWGPLAPSWSWDQGTDMYATSISGAERLENGNTLVTWGPRGTFYEVTLEGEIVWKYVNPVIGTGPLNQGETIPQGQKPNSQQNTVFKTHRYNSSFPGFVGKDLTPSGFIEGWTDNCDKEESIPWDSDGDGCIDDSDADGVKDNVDICPGFDDNVDVDGDSVPDGCDDIVDSDGDGVNDSVDQCPGFDDNIDADQDGLPDDCDDLIDSDGDGVSDDLDQCEGYDDSIDADEDSVPDGCDDAIEIDLPPVISFTDLYAQNRKDGVIYLTWYYDTTDFIWPDTGGNDVDQMVIYHCIWVDLDTPCDPDPQADGLTPHYTLVSYFAGGYEFNPIPYPGHYFQGENGTKYTFLLQIENGNTDDLGKPLNSGSQSITVIADGALSPTPNITNVSSIENPHPHPNGTWSNWTFTWSATEAQDVSTWIVCWSATESLFEDEGFIPALPHENNFDIPTCAESFDSETTITIGEASICGYSCDISLYFAIIGKDSLGNYETLTIHSLDLVNDGVLLDSDGDGVIDSEDLCEGYNDTIDQDSDGLPDGCDPTPLPIEPESEMWSWVGKALLTSGKIVALILVLVLISVAGLLFSRSSISDSELEDLLKPLPNQETPSAEAPSEGPPIPETGLPEGWTMEQWGHYGQQYLDQMEEP